MFIEYHLNVLFVNIIKIFSSLELTLTRRKTVFLKIQIRITIEQQQMLGTFFDLGFRNNRKHYFW